MNQPIRRVAIFCFLLIASLLVSSNYLQVVNADSYKARDGNRRILLDAFAFPRGKILTADGTVIADSVPSGGIQYKYQRTYPLKNDYANITGYKSVNYGATDIEFSLDKYLQGTDSSESVANFMDTLTGKSKKGGDVQLTLQNPVQQAAIKNLGAKVGSVVALDPTTGAILAMYSSPSFDPNPVANNIAKTSAAAAKALDADKTKPNLNHTIGENYAPGSIFKIVTTAAALESGQFTESAPNADAPTKVLTWPGSNTQLINEDGETCNGTDLKTALAQSCNTVYGWVADKVGAPTMAEYAQKFGFNNPGLKVPMKVAQSNFPTADQLGSDSVRLAQDSIGQTDTQVTPLQAAMIAGAVANGGAIMQPYLVDKETAPNGHVTYKGSDHQHVLSQAMQPQTAATIDNMMQYVVTNGTAQPDQVANIGMGAKTGTAQQDNNNPLAWFICYGSANGKKVAVAVMIQNLDPSVRSDISGAKFAGPVAAAVLKAALGVN